MGIEKVILHYEGSKIEILAPTVQVMRDANGIERRYLGWWATIARPETVSGHAHVYWEAIPQNANLQRRVIGPFQYSPQPSLHDAMLTVTPSAGVVAGKSYQTISSALDWCAVNKRQNPLITITEPGTYDLAKINGLYQGEGYASIAASTPVTISLSPGGAGYYRPGYTGLHFVGQAITLDFVNATHFYAESVSNCNRPTWFDGCYLTCSAGSYSLVNKAPRNSLAALVRGRAIFTEATVRNLWNSACYSSLVRGCTFENCWADLADNSDVVVGNRVFSYDSSEYYHETACMTVTYTGPEENASIAMDGYNNMPRTMTAKYGNFVSHLKIDVTPECLASNSNYSVRNVVDWINSLPGWDAKLLDDSLRAACIQKGRVVGPWTEESVKGRNATFYTMVDIHSDFYQTCNMENAVVADNILTDCACQNIFLAGGFSKDIFIVNNSFHNKKQNSFASQLSCPHSHVVIIHNSFSSQGWGFRTDFTGAPGSITEKYQPDVYCLFSHNVALRIAWAGPPVTGGMIRENHIFAGSTVPSQSTGTTVGGTSADLFANPQAGDFAPKGALLASKRVPLVRFDQLGQPRPDYDAVGARTG